MSSKRLSTSYENLSQGFYRREQEFKKQFFHIYAKRLQHLGELLKTKAEKEFGTSYPFKKISEINEESPETCIIIGTLFKDQVLKPSILKELSEDNQLVPLPPRSNYNDEHDLLVLEDELQRIKLSGEINVHELVTGVIAAVRGQVNSDGVFLVEDCMFYESGPEIPLKIVDSSPLVVFISGLDLSNPEAPLLSFDLFQQWLYGNLELHSAEEVNPFPNPLNVVRVIIAGNSLRASPAKIQKNASTMTLRTIDTKEMLTSLKYFDDIIENISQSVEIDLMPGEFDPSNQMLPQQPFHHCMFPKSATNKNFNGVPNPYQFELEDRLILGTSGQNIDDIRKFSTVESPIEGIKNCLRWSHIAPTCPDTLPCYPYFDKDPFIITRCPHVFFCSQNNLKFETEMFINSNGQKTRLISIPSFQKCQTIAVLNINTLECTSISFPATINSDEE